MIRPAFFPGLRFPVIKDDAGTVAHVYWKNGVVADTKANAWVQNGTVPQVARSGRTPAAAGAFTDANYYSLGSGNEVLDFSGNFSMVLIVGNTTSTGVIVSNGTAGVDGYYVRTSSGYAELAVSNGATVTPIGNVGSGLVGISVFCCGRSAGSVVAKTNLGAYASAAAGGVITPATTTTAKIGRYSGLTLSYASTVYEAWFSTTTPSDALFTSIQTRVKSRLGITAW